MNRVHGSPRELRGLHDRPGIVPRLCRALCPRVDLDKKPGAIARGHAKILRKNPDMGDGYGYSLSLQKKQASHSPLLAGPESRFSPQCPACVMNSGEARGGRGGGGGEARRGEGRRLGGSRPALRARGAKPASTARRREANGGPAAKLATVWTDLSRNAGAGSPPWFPTLLSRVYPLQREA